MCETERQKRGAINAHIQRAKRGGNLTYYFGQFKRDGRMTLTVEWSEKPEEMEEGLNADSNSE